MSAGPTGYYADVYTIRAMNIFDARNILSEGVIKPIINKLPGVFESFAAILPTILFFILILCFKLSMDELKGIISGLGFTLFGLTIFLPVFIQDLWTWDELLV